MAAGCPWFPAAEHRHDPEALVPGTLWQSVKGCRMVCSPAPLHACLWANRCRLVHVATRLVLRDTQHPAIPFTEWGPSQLAQAGGRHRQPEAAAGGGQAAVPAPRPGDRRHDADVCPGEARSCGIQAGHQQACAASVPSLSPGSGSLPASTAGEALPQLLTFWPALPAAAGLSLK